MYSRLRAGCGLAGAIPPGTLPVFKACPVAGPRWPPGDLGRAAPRAVTWAGPQFAVRFPGSTVDAVMWLPIDAKFPREDYERLLDAQERADLDAARSSGAALERRVRLDAARLCPKYVAAPHTTEFAILFLPT